MKEEGSGLEGKVAVVTGAGSKGEGFGTGKATAVLLSRAGAKVVLVDRHEDRAQDTKRIIVEQGGDASIVIVDLATAADCDQVVHEAVSTFGGLDILVNNAAAFASGTILDTTEADFERVIRVNLAVPFLLSKAAIPVMIERSGGSVVFISSVVALRGPGPHAYATAKSGLQGLTVSLANTYGPDGIRFNTVIPGMVSTPMRAASIQEAGFNEDDLSTGRATATGSFGDAWDVAHAVLFLSTPAAKHVTGVMLPVDGGATTRLA